MVVDQRRQQIMRRADSVHVAGEVEVDVLHRHDLGVTAAGSTALHAEARAETRLAQACNRILADPVQPVAQAHGRRRFSFARRGRRDGGDQDQLAVRFVLHRIDEIRGQLGLVRAIAEQIVARNTQLRTDLPDRLHGCGAGNFDIALRGHRCSSLLSLLLYLSRPRDARGPLSCETQNLTSHNCITNQTRWPAGLSNR